LQPAINSADHGADYKYMHVLYIFQKNSHFRKYELEQELELELETEERRTVTVEQSHRKGDTGTVDRG
jgi:hypothetical protein